MTGEAHYEDIAKGYEDAFFYASGPYQEHLVEKVSRHLEFARSPGPEAVRLVDLGGGTGNFTQALCDRNSLTIPALCVDPFQEMLDQAAPYTSVKTLCLGAVEFAAQQEHQPYDRVLLKEVVHHIAESDVPAMYQGLYNHLTAGGIALTVTRPQEVDYPLFQAARQVWRENQPAHSVFMEGMKTAGFHVEEVVQHNYTVEMSKEKWLGMVRSRFWSTFSKFSEAELEAGVQELEEQFQDRDTLVFEDRMLFLIGRKTTLLTSVTSQSLREEFTQRGGLVIPHPVLDATEANTAYSNLLNYERGLSGGSISGDWRFKVHMLLPWMWRLIHHPAILDVVAAVLHTQHILCWSTDIFIKEPGDNKFTSWHQDAAYVGMSPPDVVTVWLALTRANQASGCLRIVPGSHLQPTQPHEVTMDPNNLLLKGQTILNVTDEGIPLELEPGCISIHHIGTVHSSGPNTSSERRVGIAIRYMAAHVNQNLSPRDSVVVVRGPPVDNYEMEKEPLNELDENAISAHACAVQRVYPDNHEQTEKSTN